MSTLTERVARAMWQATAPGGIYDLLADQQKQQICAEARAAIREVLADMLRYATDDYRDAVAVSLVNVYARVNGIELAAEGTAP